MHLTSAVIKYLAENPTEIAIVEAANEMRITSAVASFNRARGRGYTVKLGQAKMVLLDLATCKSSAVWRLWIKDIHPKEVVPRRVRKDKGQARR